MVEQAFVTAGYNVEWFTLEQLPVNRTVVALLDLDEPFFDDAATIPCVCSTVVYSLLEIGELVKGQSVLIHSACGGVELAAIQVCKMLGAEIFATVGNGTKTQYLVKAHDIPRHRIFNSRDTSFKQGVLNQTKGRGVDIVLNSLSGEGLHASWDCTAPFGKMIEIGKRDMIGRGKLDMNPFLENRSFFGVDLQHMGAQHPEKLRSILVRTMEYIQSGQLKAIHPQNIFDAQNVQGAFRKMQGGQHMGKILLRILENTDQIPSSAFEKSVTFASDAVYLLVGGFGGLGIAISRWMVERGARNFLFLSRSAGTTSHSRCFIKELEEMGCTAKVATGSVSNIADVQAAIALSRGRLAGVIQLGMNLRDRRFTDMTHDDWTSVLAPKVEGTRNLYKVLQNQSLDFLVVFSSVIGISSNAGQANYAAANSFLDAFVKRIRHAGFPACVIDLGAVEDVGYVSSDEILLKRCRRIGARLLTAYHVLQAVERAILEAGAVSMEENDNMGRLIVGLEVAKQTFQMMSFNDRRFAALNQTDSSVKESQDAKTNTIISWISSLDGDPQILSQQSVKDSLLKQLGYVIQTYSGAVDPVDLDEAAGDIAVDSLMAIEIRSWLRQYCNVDIPAVKLAKAKNVKGLTALVLQGLRTKYKLEDPMQS